MEHNDGVYQQIIEVNNTSQAGSEFVSEHLVQEVVLQNANNQGSLSTENCQIPGIEIILPNDYIQMQEQSSNNVVLCTADMIGGDNHVESVILSQEESVVVNDQGISRAISVEGTISSCSQNLQEQKLDDFIIQNQNQTPYHQDNFDVNNSNFVTNRGNDNQPVGDNAVGDAQSVVENSSDVKENSVNELEPSFQSEVQVDTPELVSSGQTEAGALTEMSVSGINELINEAIRDTQETHEDQTKNHVIKSEETNKPADSNDTEVHLDKDVHTSPLPQSPEKVNYLKKGDIAETIPADNSSVLQSDDVAVLAEFGTMLQDQEEGKPEVAAKVDDQVFQNISDFINEKSRSEESKAKNHEEESTTKSEPAEHTKSDVKSNDVSICEDEDLDLHLSADQSTDNHRKVLQDIFADWQDENGEEDATPSSTAALPSSKDAHDSVEMELQSLLNEEAHQDAASSTNATGNSVNSLEKSKAGSDNQNAGSSHAKTKSVTVDKTSSKPSIKSPKPTTNSTSAKDGQSPKNPISNVQLDSKKMQSPRPGVKVPGSHLTSQIATTAEVNEVLKERLKEKQKDLQNPKTPDVVFVKKMSQRLSSQLAAAALASAVPPSAQPAQQQQQQLSESNDSEKVKSSAVELPSAAAEPSKSSTDNNDLLAILEGDVDPDWSNLKPHSILEENSKTTDSHGLSDGKLGSKLDPITERELALKQLLELPSVSSKKKPGRRSTKSGTDEPKDDVINISSSGDDSPKREAKTPKQQKENNSQNTRNSESMELAVEESRSGRKRKLTEKAREHELSVKRQKVIKGKPTPDSKKTLETPDVEKEKSDTSVSTTTGTTPKAAETPKSTREASPAATPKDAKQKKSDAKQTPASAAKTPATVKDKETKETKETKEIKETPSKRSSIGISKKDTPIAKRKLAVKSMLRQKKAGAATAAKTKASSPVATSPNKSTPEKPTNASAAPKEKKKTVSEIDRLLQDEGIVNMLYDAEQEDSRKRLVPITKSQKKVMDVDKAERELKFRAKLVKNAVLRLRNSGATTTKVSPRSRRNATAAAATPAISEQQQAPQQQQQQQTEKKSMSESNKSSEPLDFILPTKIRNAADASRIIRRHSSSSFSSTSASPRVSIDQPPESINVEELETLMKGKRKTSHDSSADKSAEAKKGKKKSLSKSDVETKESEKSPAKKESTKKATRSNASTPPATATAAASASKSKKAAKGSNKSSVKSSPIDAKSTSKGEDELSACLAEAASALLSNNSGNRSSGASANRKKGSANVSTTQEDEKVDTKKLFSNKEISVKYHGHLVQLILTPSLPASGIRNALTIQAMNEFREALTILRKDDNCRVVLFTSTGTSFCEGLELSSLLHSNLEERKVRAKEMALALKEFLRCLASFNKPIVAGVQGAAIGLGVTMLPLFDLVIASDKATFSTPYGKLGQIAEGTAVLALSRSLGTSVTNELLLGGRVLTASEALRAGLVTRVLWPDRFQGELLPSLKSMSEQSARSMEATKTMLRRSLRENFDPYLDSESYLLVQHWISAESQEAMKAFIDEKGQ